VITLWGKARAVTPATLALPANVQACFDTPRLSGASRYTHWGYYIYDAWLWTGSQGIDTATLAQPFALALRFAREFSGPHLARRILEEIGLIGRGTPAQRAEWLRWLSAALPDIEAGDVMIGIHRPGAGVCLVLNGEPQASSHDAALAQALFSIWLDARTRAPALRSALLERSRPN
jgi:hypothetical protein